MVLAAAFLAGVLAFVGVATAATTVSVTTGVTGAFARAAPSGGQTADVSDRVTISIDSGIADVRLNRPDKLNALDGAMFQAIADAGEALKSETGPSGRRALR